MTNMQVFEAVADGRMTPEEGAEYMMMLREKESAERWGRYARVGQVVMWVAFFVSAAWSAWRR